MFDGPKPHVGRADPAAGRADRPPRRPPAARMSDMCTCVGPPDTIIMGSPAVLIGGRPAARMGDSTAHGGVIVGGYPMVIIN